MKKSQESVVVAGPTWRAMLAFAWHGLRLVVGILTQIALYMFATLGGLLYLTVRSMTEDDFVAFSMQSLVDLLRTVDLGLQAGFMVGLIILALQCMWRE
jgi:hypothetical protein